MPLPWKKTRVTRFSRIVADLPSPRHGGSLVVETGFPTSLIDLFFKNRDRLRKPSTKKWKKTKRTEPELSDPLTPPAPSPSPRSSCPSSLIGNPSQPAFLKDLNFEELEEEEETVGDHGGEPVPVQEEGRVGGCGEWSGVFVAVVKIFVVVILALSTKKLAVGITLSAFVLVLLDCVGKHAVCFMKPCADAKLALRPLAQRASVIFRIKKDNTELRKGKDCDLLILREEDAVLNELVGRTEEEFSSIEEIQLVESNSDTNSNIEGSYVRGPQLDFLAGHLRWGCLDDEKNLRVLEEYEEGIQNLKGKSGCSKRSKLKAKIIKKLVPKKLLSEKKQKKKKGKKGLEFSSEASSFLEDGKHKLDVKQEQEVPYQEIRNEEEEEEADEEEDTNKGGFNCDECKQKEEEVTTVIRKEVKNVGKEGNSGYIVLILVVLAGLAGGRILALLLTVTGCFMFKLSEARRRSSLNVRLIG